MSKSSLGLEHQLADETLNFLDAALEMLRTSKRSARRREHKLQLGGFIAALGAMREELRVDAVTLRGAIDRAVEGRS
jgi:hypothetical protein